MPISKNEANLIRALEHILKEIYVYESLTSNCMPGSTADKQLKRKIKKAQEAIAKARGKIR